MEKFKFSEYRRVYLPVNFKPVDSLILRDIFFKVDTGADSSTIDKRILYNLGYDRSWVLENLIIEGETSTADGRKVSAGLVQVP